MTDGVDRQRAGEEISLAAIASLVLQLAQLGVLLDSFGQRFETERGAEFDEGVYEGGALGRVGC